MQNDRQTPLTREFFRLTVPNILSNITVPLVGLADTIMLGHLPDIRFLAGVALGAVIFDFIYWSFGFLRMGTTGMTAQAVGRDDMSEVMALLLRSLLVAGVIGVTLLLLQLPLQRLGFFLLSGSSETEQAGAEYFSARIFGAPAVLANYVFLGWFLGRGKSTYALIMTACGNLANIALNYVFIYQFQLAARGAGLGSMLSQYTMLVVALLLFFKNRPPARVQMQALLDRSAIKRLLALNRDIMVRTIGLIGTFALFTNFSASLGVVVLAANSIFLRLLEFAAYLIDGAAFATESLAGMLHGRNDSTGLRQLLKLAIFTGEAFALVCIVVLLLFQDTLFAIMTSHSEVISLLAENTPLLAATLVFSTVAYILDGYFLGKTAGRLLRNCMLLSAGVAFLPLALIALHLRNNTLLWLSMIVFMIARVVTLWWWGLKKPAQGR